MTGPGALRAIVPLAAALVSAGVGLAVIGIDPIRFFADVVTFGVAGNGWQESLIRAAPLIVVATGLIVAFRGQLWNLGSDGQYLLAAALVTGLVPLAGDAGWPIAATWALAFVAAAVAGAGLCVLPAFLKARFGTTEIITSLAMSFIGIGSANLLIKGPFRDTGSLISQTRTIGVEAMAPYLGSTRVHAGLVLALAIAAGTHVVLSRSAAGLRLDVVGASPRAAAHMGISPARTTWTALLASGAIIGMAAAIDMLGQWGYLRADWNPAYGAAALPFVFLARLSAVAAIPLVGLYAVLATGGTLAAQRSGLSVDFLLVVLALLLLFMGLVEYVGKRRDLGASYLPEGLRRAFAGRVGSGR